MLKGYSDISRGVASRLNIRIIDAEEICKAFIEEIIYSLQCGDEVKLKGLGRFILSDVPEKVGVNPLTKKQLIVPAKTKVRFRIADNLKQKINNPEDEE